MKSKIGYFKEIWELENGTISILPTNDEIIAFQSKNNVLFPYDLMEYFRILNGSNNEYDDRFFRFYSLSNFKSINDELKYWNGIPDYSNIVNTLTEYKSFYVFADFSFCMFSYAIKLYPDTKDNNLVLVLCGDKYRVIANSFSEFIDLYLNNSIELQLG